MPKWVPVVPDHSEVPELDQGLDSEIDRPFVRDAGSNPDLPIAHTSLGVGKPRGDRRVDGSNCRHDPVVLEQREGNRDPPSRVEVCWPATLRHEILPSGVLGG
jgi:hypothetical protein